MDVAASLRGHGVNWIGGLGIWAAVLVLSTFAADPGDALVRNTIRLSLAWYVLAAICIIRMQSADWASLTRKARWARYAWTWSLISYLTHMAFAFHVVHDWSHAEAFAHTRAASGWGEGIYVSYLFTGLWTADVIWWWWRPQRYVTRPPVIGCALHAFLAAIVVNGAIVFAGGPVRWISAALLAAVLLVWARTITRRRKAADGT